VFAQSGLDVALLEVGLGGRLDAVNLVDAVAAIVTTIDLDHQDWLGDDRDSIGREKAGIFRRGRPAVIADPSPPDGLVDAARDIGANVVRAGVDFRIERDASGWRWIGGDTVVALPDPTLAAPCQHANAAGAIALLHAMRDRLGFDPAALARGVVAARVPGRLQQSSGQPGLIIDVAHNPQAARVLARWLADHPVDGRTFAVFSALGDKDIAGIGAAVAAQIDRWFVAGLDAETDRGLDAERVAAKLDDVADQLSRHADVTRALDAAFESRGSGDRIVAFGSFHVAAAALRWKPAGTDRA
jgi:dihydrofolate synthase/folylpolyglutamate synthase